MVKSRKVMFGFEKAQRMRIRRKLEMNGIEYRRGQGQGPMLGVNIVKHDIIALLC